MALEPLRATLYDLKTGNYLRRIPIKTAPWGKELNRWGKLEVTLPRSTSANLPLLRSLAQPWRTLLVLTRGQRVIHAGPVTARPFGDRLQLKGEGFGAVFRKRLVLNRALRGMTLDGEVLIDEDNPAPEWQLTFSGSYVDIAAKLVEETYVWGELPVTTPPRQGGIATRTYYGYDFATVEERLLQLTKLENGPELRFTPKLVTGGIQFDLEGATELVNKHHRWSTEIPGDRCTIGRIDDDGEAIVTDQWMLGGRNEDIMLLTRAKDAPAVAPAVNKILDPRLTSVNGYPATRVSRGVDPIFPGAQDGVPHNGLLLHSPDPKNNDSFASVRTDAGFGISMEMEAGKSYVFSATGSVRSILKGTPHPRARRIVVFHRAGSGAYTEVMSPPIPDLVEAGGGGGVRLRVEFTLPPETTEAFIRLYHGHTAGSVAWAMPRLSEKGNDPEVDDGAYFWGGKPAGGGYAYAWQSTPDLSPSSRTVTTPPPPLLQGYPLLQIADTSHSTVSEIGTLRGYAREAILRGARTQEVIDVTVSAEEDVEPGDWADVRTVHPLYGEVVLPLKVVAVSGDTSDRIKLSCRIRNGEEPS